VRDPACPSASDRQVYSRVVGTAPESANSQGERRPSDSLDPSYAGSQVWAEQTAIGGFVSETPHRAEAEIDGAGCQMPRFQVHAISKDNGLTEREPRLRAVPFDELLDRVPVASLSIDRTEAVQHRRLCLVQVRQPQDRFRYAPLRFAQLLSCHLPRPP